MKFFALSVAAVTAREPVTFNQGESIVNLVLDENGNTLELVTDIPAAHQPRNEGNDIFYPKRLLKFLAEKVLYNCGDPRSFLRSFLN